MPVWAKWLLGITATLVGIGIVGGATTLASHGERITAVETHYGHIMDGIEELKEDVKELK